MHRTFSGRRSRPIVYDMKKYALALAIGYVGIGWAAKPGVTEIFDLNRGLVAAHGDVSRVASAAADDAAECFWVGRFVGHFDEPFLIAGKFVFPGGADAAFLRKLLPLKAVKEKADLLQRACAAGEEAQAIQKVSAEAKDLLEQVVKSIQADVQKAVLGIKM